MTVVVCDILVRWRYPNVAVAARDDVDAERHAMEMYFVLLDQRWRNFYEDSLAELFNWC